MSEFTCNGISRSFKNFQLDHISFSMESGYFYVLIGVNGSGKTTLLNCISGVTDRFTGDARIDNRKYRVAAALSYLVLHALNNAYHAWLRGTVSGC